MNKNLESIQADRPNIITTPIEAIGFFRVLGNDGYRILLTKKDEIIYFQDIMNHDKYDRLTKDC